MDDTSSRHDQVSLPQPRPSPAKHGVPSRVAAPVFLVVPADTSRVLGPSSIPFEGCAGSTIRPATSTQIRLAQIKTNKEEKKS